MNWLDINEGKKKNEIYSNLFKIRIAIIYATICACASLKKQVLIH